MGLFTSHHLKKLQQAIIEADLTVLKKQFSRLEDELLRQHRFSFNDQSINAAELAIMAQQPKSLEHLLQSGFGLSPTLPKPLIYQALQQPRHSLALLTVLLQCGAAMEYPDQQPEHVLFACLEYCPDNSLMLHLSRLNEYGADLNSRNREGHSVLMQVLQLEQQPLVQMLVNSGAELPDSIPEGWCSDAIIGHAQRCADDLKIRQLMLG